MSICYNCLCSQFFSLLLAKKRFILIQREPKASFMYPLTEKFKNRSRNQMSVLLNDDNPPVGNIFY